MQARGGDEERERERWGKLKKTTKKSERIRRSRLTSIEHLGPQGPSGGAAARASCYLLPIQAGVQTLGATHVDWPCSHAGSLHLQRGGKDARP